MALILVLDHKTNNLVIMRKLLIYTFPFLILIGCTTVKNTQKQLNSGNYNSVISNSIEKLRNNKERKKSQSYICLLYTSPSPRDS